MRGLRTYLWAPIAFALVASAQAQTGYARVSSYPTAVVADGKSTVTITALVTDSHGSPVADGSEVYFETNLGTFQQSVVATRSGYARAVLIASDISGTATVTAHINGFAIAPVSCTVDFAATRADLSASKEYIEVVSPTFMRFSQAQKLLYAESPRQGVSLEYREVGIKADRLQVNIDNYEVRATNATLTMGKKSQFFRELNFTLNTKVGTGFSDYQENVVTSATIDGGRIEIQKRSLFGRVSIEGSIVQKSDAPYFSSAYDYADLTTSPILISSERAVLIPHKEVQFERAAIYVGDAKVLTAPLYRTSLNGYSNSSFGDQMISVNDNQVAVSYPYYLTLRPGQTSLLRFHLGDNASSSFTGFGAGNGPQLDYEVDWNKGDRSDGRFVLSGLGQQSWGIGFHQAFQFGDHASVYSDIQMPQAKSIFGSLNGSKQFGEYNLTAGSNISHTLVGYSETDQISTLSFQRNSFKLPSLPFRLTYGLTSTMQSTTANVPIKFQESYGLTTSLQSLPWRVDKSTTLNSSITVSQLEGQNVQKGLTLGATTTLSKQINRSLGLFFTYNYTQDPFESGLLGRQHLSGSANYQFKRIFATVSAGSSLDGVNFDMASQLMFPVGRDWHLGWDTINQRFLGSTFSDTNFALYYGLGGREFGLMWSRYTKRFGIIVLGTPLN